MDDQQRVRAAPIRKVLRVRAKPEIAFKVFAERMGQWWNKDHSVLKVMGKAPQSTVIIEPRESGRWYEVGEDGSEYDWGRVLTWEPPARVVLAWQLTAEWQYDPNFETIVEVTFTADGDFTSVVFEHRDLDRYGDAASQQRDGMDSGWEMLLAHYAQAVDDPGRQS